MSSSDTERGSQVERASQAPPERFVYVMQEQASDGPADDGISLRELWGIWWHGKWIIIAVTAAFALGAVAYGLAQTHWYRAEALLVPVDARSVPSIGGQLGGLAALAGVSVGGGRSAEPLATLRSREFARAFIEDFALLHVFFADDWNDDLGQWRAPDPTEWPDLRDAVTYFHDNILKVSEDNVTGLVTLGIEWTDPQAAARWADTLVQRLNNRLRDRALLEAEANVTYLQSELAETNVVTLQQSIGRLLESELQKLMLARGREEFAFRVIDAAEVPKSPARPRRTFIAIIGTILGGLLGSFGVLAAHLLRGSATDRKSVEL